MQFIYLRHAEPAIGPIDVPTHTDGTLHEGAVQGILAALGSKGMLIPLRSIEAEGFAVPALMIDWGERAVKVWKGEALRKYQMAIRTWVPIDDLENLVNAAVDASAEFTTAAYLTELRRLMPGLGWVSRSGKDFE